jgi:hypothetical protein
MEGQDIGARKLKSFTERRPGESAASRAKKNPDEKENREITFCGFAHALSIRN